MRCGQQSAGFSGFVEQRDAHVDSPFRIVLEAILPFGIVEVDFENRVAYAISTTQCPGVCPPVTRADTPAATFTV
ncbi:MAG: hypothetical protein QOD67_3094 [Caballeronia sp.]|jgi:hypothetical protein|nr:hypothetical protein [Caballeronia sp.]